MDSWWSAHLGRGHGAWYVHQTQTHHTSIHPYTGWSTLELLVPGFSVDLERLKASEWASLLSTTDLVATKLITVKTAFPGIDLPTLVAKYPRILLHDVPTLQRNLAEVDDMAALCVQPPLFCYVVVGTIGVALPH